MWWRLVYVSHLQGNDTNAVGQRFNRINAGVCGFVRASCLIDTVRSLRTAVGRRALFSYPNSPTSTNTSITYFPGSLPRTPNASCSTLIAARPWSAWIGGQ